MTPESTEWDAGLRRRSSWAGVWWVEGAVVGALVVSALAFLDELGDCSLIGGCTPEESKTEPGTYVLFATALGLLFVGLATAAHASGRPVVNAAAREALGCFAVAGGVWLAASAPSGADLGPAAPLALALGLASALAVRSAGPHAGTARLLGIALLATVALAVDELGGLVLVLLAVPLAIGVADTIALRLGAAAER